MLCKVPGGVTITIKHHFSYGLNGYVIPQHTATITSAFHFGHSYTIIYATVVIRVSVYVYQYTVPVYKRGVVYVVDDLKVIRNANRSSNRYARFVRHAPCNQLIQHHA